jgi:hypothetical protein
LKLLVSDGQHERAVDPARIANQDGAHLAE